MPENRLVRAREGYEDYVYQPPKEREPFIPPCRHCGAVGISVAVGGTLYVVRHKHDCPVVSEP